MHVCMYEHMYVGYVPCTGRILSTKCSKACPCPTTDFDGSKLVNVQQKNGVTEFFGQKAKFWLCEALCVICIYQKGSSRISCHSKVMISHA
jgi:hypothetical protein